jgi:hypothetical protein
MKKSVWSLALLLLVADPSTAVTAASPDQCDRTCLNGFLDQYLDALAARDPSKLPLAEKVRYTENNVALKVGDGMWGTALGFKAFDVRFADPSTGSIGFHGELRETDGESPFALRLQIRSGRIVEIEAVVARPSESGVPFVTVNHAPVAALNDLLAPAERSSRARMIQLADGYLSTLQQNDGRLYTEFAEDCTRVENGMQTTNNPDAVKYSIAMGWPCIKQFGLGFYRFDDRLRDRRFLVVDEERGLIMAVAFIDHSGRTGEYKLTDGRVINSRIRHPHTFYMFETFRIRSGKIHHVEAVFTTVPYRMPSPWGVAGFHYQ